MTPLERQKRHRAKLRESRPMRDLERAWKSATVDQKIRFLRARVGAQMWLDVR
jgi:hypothetical protein